MTNRSTVLRRILRNVRGEIRFSEPMRDHTTYKVGGEAEVLFSPDSISDAIAVHRMASREAIPLTIIGAGSNVIAPDDGLDGIVLEMKRKHATLEFLGDGLVRAHAGVLLTDLARSAAKRGLVGLEPLSCIPGTVGGAVIMNAGTHEGDTSDVLHRIGVCTSRGRTRIFHKQELSFGYRTSILMGSDWMILWAEFRLPSGSRRSALNAMAKQRKDRERRYPLKYPSAGSVFKRPPDDYPGRLIESCGCKGMRVGGAVVSDRHANFIVNTGKATAADIMELISRIRKKVYEKTGIYLELEQIPLGGGIRK
jgi:UDP-N-acetylmuramate dehydrogenase